MISKSRAVARVQLWCLDVLWQSHVAGTLLIAGEMLFRLLAYWRRRVQLKSAISVPVPVIVVGNISVGGTGKTPVTRGLANILRGAGYKPGIFSRGYGGQSVPRLVSATHKATDVGDEALMLARDFPVAVGPNRALTAHLLIEQGCDVLIGDDGLQHYRLVRDVEIATVDARRGFGNGRCFPAGFLRERTSRLRSVDYILLAKTPKTHPELAKTLNHIKEIVPVSYWTLKILGLRNLANGRLYSLKSAPLGSEVNAVAGIANPAGFFEQLSALGLNLRKYIFPDHHQYRLADLHFANELPVVLTEKDAVKCATLCGLDMKRYWSLEVESELNKTFAKSLLTRIQHSFPPTQKAHHLP